MKHRIILAQEPKTTQYYFWYTFGTYNKLENLKLISSSTPIMFKD